MSARREEIIDVAKGLFAQHGYASTSMRDIAEACDLLAGSLYSHFRSKAHLLELVILPFYDVLIPGQRAALEMNGSGADRIEEMLRCVLSVCADHDAELTILHYDWSHLVGIDELTDVVARSNETLDLWEQALTMGHADGSLRTSVTVPTAVRILTSSIHGVLDRRRFDTRENLRTKRGPDELADETLALLIDGLRSPAARGPRRRRPQHSTQ
ncbi:MAG: TetR/AcrR family transcriptional regulator [Actinomycetota bacterium]|nr:TetR/AcrR family transcriptional regulator [Actinomycetota bacterium]